MRRSIQVAAFAIPAVPIPRPSMESAASAKTASWNAFVRAGSGWVSAGARSAGGGSDSGASAEAPLSSGWAEASMTRPGASDRAKPPQTRRAPHRKRESHDREITIPS
jgi:hypothetical protein